MAVRGVIGYDDANKPVIDPAEASSAFADHAKSMLFATTSKIMAISALSTLRTASGWGSYSALVERLLALVPSNQSAQFTLGKPEK